MLMFCSARGRSVASAVSKEAEPSLGVMQRSEQLFTINNMVTHEHTSSLTQLHSSNNFCFTYNNRHFNTSHREGLCICLAGYTTRSVHSVIAIALSIINNNCDNDAVIAVIVMLVTVVLLLLLILLSYLFVARPLRQCMTC